MLKSKPVWKKRKVRHRGKSNICRVVVHVCTVQCVTEATLVGAAVDGKATQCRNLRTGWNSWNVQETIDQQGKGGAKRCFRSARASWNTSVRPFVRPQENLDHICTGINASWIIWRLIKPTPPQPSTAQCSLIPVQPSTAKYSQYPNPTRNPNFLVKPDPNPTRSQKALLVRPWSQDSDAGNLVSHNPTMSKEWQKDTSRTTWGAAARLWYDEGRYFAEVESLISGRFPLFCQNQPVRFPICQHTQVLQVLRRTI